MSHLLPVHDICMKGYCLAKFDTCDGVSPDRCHATSLTNADLLFTESLLNILKLHLTIVKYM